MLLFLIMCFQDIGSVYSMMGEDKGTYWMRKRRQEEQQQQNAFMGQDIAVALAGMQPYALSVTVSY